MRKKRILFVSESSFLATGFSNYNRILIEYIYKTGKYDIAEFGSYGQASDPRALQLPWKQYFATPDNAQEAERYGQGSQHPADKGMNINQFGAMKFDEVVLDFRPDVVVCNRDHWMDCWIARSPYRHMFKWLWMPTVDSVPQQEEWIHTYESCNAIMSYTDFGIDTLSKNSQRLGNPNLRPYLHMVPLRTPVDTTVFRPMDREELKKEWFGARPDVPVIVADQVLDDRRADRKVILSTMRNQSRKLFPDLIDSFARMKVKYNTNPIVQKSILWLHTSYPDNQSSYDYPRHIARLVQGYYGVLQHVPDLHKHIFQTYMCETCGHVFAGYAIHLHGKPVENRSGQPGAGRIYVVCQKCGQRNATCPTTAGGVSRDVLAQIYACADLYVQLAIAEGEGIPPIEAKACGTPVLALDYSALSEKVRVPDYNHIDRDTYTVHKGGMPVNVDRYYYEPETSQRRALPDIEDCADKMFKILINDELRKQMSDDARQCVIDNYGADSMCQRWEFLFDNIDAPKLEETWDAPIEIKDPPEGQPPDNLSPDQFLDWLYQYVLRIPVDEQGKQNWLRGLAAGQHSYQSIYEYFMREAIKNRECAIKLQESQDRFHGRIAANSQRKTMFIA